MVAVVCVVDEAIEEMTGAGRAVVVNVASLDVPVPPEFVANAWKW